MIRFSIQLIRNILRQSHISIDVILRSSGAFRVQSVVYNASQPFLTCLYDISYSQFILSSMYSPKCDVFQRPLRDSSIIDHYFSIGRIIFRYY